MQVRFDAWGGMHSKYTYCMFVFFAIHLQGIKGLLEGDGQDDAPENTAASNTRTPGGRQSTAAVPITIPVPEGAMPSKVWERLQKGGSLLGDPEERMMAEGQDGNTPGSGLVKVMVARAVVVMGINMVAELATVLVEW